MQLGASAMVGFQQKRFMIADSLVQPMQIANFVFLGFQLYTIQLQIASVTITFDFGIRSKILVNNLLQGLSLDVVDYLHLCV